MSRNYKFLNPDEVYFTSFAVVEWLDVFTSNEYEKYHAIQSRGSGENTNAIDLAGMVQID
ncbi:MAG: hypothetical protein M0Q53_01600 [Prolixibacteraceae bacterium]|jgi:hypothetical protein|nr:hypothetical protein [Prolixibacteraceae bacterium]